MKPNNYWTKNKCKKEALKYNGRYEFQKGCSSAYHKALQNKWLDEICSHMISKRKQWTKEDCLKIAKKYKYNKDFRENEQTIYNYSLKKKWLKDISLHFKYNKKPNNYWDYNRCKHITLKYNRKSDLKKDYGVVYKTIYKNSWLELYDHMETVGNKNKRMVYMYIFTDNSLYIGLTCDKKRRHKQHINTDECSPVYKHIQKTNSEPLLIEKSDYLDINDAILLEKELIEKYKKSCYTLLNSRKGGELGSSKLYWTYDRCKKEASKYKFRTEFMKASSSAYTRCLKNKWLDDFFIIKRKNRYNN